MQFANPYLLWLLLLLLPVVAHYIYSIFKGGAAINISTIDGVTGAPRTFRYYLRHLPFIFRVVALALAIIALARPQSVEFSRNTTSQGIDIVLALDISGSMLARDFEPDRITAAKRVASSFVGDRFGDRIALVVFAGESFTQSPLTTDQSTLQTMLGRVRSAVGLIDDGTAIGDGLATSLNRLRESDAKSKVIILLTDGVNNSGSIAPMTAAALAKDMGVKLYTIGVGTRGTAPYPRVNSYGDIVDYVSVKVEIDEDMLREMAKTTGGEYFRATNNQALEAIYEQINTLEKSEVEISERTLYTEEYALYLLLALILIGAESLVKMFIIKRLP